jgi:hypothetical protein
MSDPSKNVRPLDTKEQGVGEADPGSWRTTANTTLGMVVSVFAVGVPLLYVVGRVFSSAYWGALGIDGSLMNVAVEESVYDGFIAVANMTFHLLAFLAPNLMLVWLGAIALLALLVFVLVLLLSWFRAGLRALVLRGERKISGLRSGDGVPSRFMRLYVPVWQVANNAFLAIVVPVFVLAMGILYVSQSGQAQAERTLLEIHAALDGRGKAVSLAASEDRHGLVVSCATEWCVLANRDGLFAVRRERISRIEACASVINPAGGALACVPVRPRTR